MPFVLIHGGGSTGRFWDRLLPFLDGPSLAVDLPGRLAVDGDLESLTIQDEADAVVEQIRDAEVSAPIVLVAHSSGGLVVPLVADALGDDLVAVVLSAALVPEGGGCGLDCMKPSHADSLRAAVEQSGRTGHVITLPGTPEDPEQFRNAYGGDPLDDETLGYVVDPVRCVPDTVNHYFQPVFWSSVKDTPVIYVLNELDRPVPAHVQEEMVAHLPSSAEVIRLNSGHIPAVTMPIRFAEILNVCRRETERD